MSVARLSYTEQLLQLQMKTVMARAVGDIESERLFLSLAESVKTARDHELNCPKGERDER